MVTTDDPYQIATEIHEGLGDWPGHPTELLDDVRFQRGVTLLAARGYTVDELLDFTRHRNRIGYCMALAVLARRADAVNAQAAILDRLPTAPGATRHFILRALNAHAPASVLAALLLRLDSTWNDPASLDAVAAFVRERADREKDASFGALLDGASSDWVEAASEILPALGHVLPAGILPEFERWRARSQAVNFLATIGRVWRTAPPAEPPVLDPMVWTLAKAEIRQRVPARRSVAVVGESGVGKTTLIRQVARELHDEGWVVLEATGADLLAGQVYIGEVEGRVRALVQRTAGVRVVWINHEFEELQWSGRHRFSPGGLLETLLPHIAAGRLVVIAEMRPGGYEALARARPGLRTALDVCRLEPLGDDDTTSVLYRWADAHALADGRPVISESNLREAHELAKQFLPTRVSPGNPMQLLHRARERVAQEASERPIDRADVIRTLGELTGLPAMILDDREPLDIGALRAFFQQRVLGQPEAVDCLVERVAMIKAGLTDPRRPQGVFLFVGPTGTGKTEIAKTLAEFLFGSPQRMIRLDMTEFQSAEAVYRILGAWTEEHEGSALVDAIRKQPFSVVLLDEVEKAHPAIWDLFLQVFDDGRLTDRRGGVVDFRHAIVIMTSNLGAGVDTGRGIGFTSADGPVERAAIERAVGQAFRPEFVNRIDRIVVFRPLTRTIMRELLRKELGEVLRRRGLRSRPWAIEWDDAALEFLVDRGFSPRFGARPLKRAIEHYLLAPLALTVANLDAPEGEQFLFVKTDGQRLSVTFVDPDADDADGLPATEASPGPLDVRTLAVEGRGMPEEVAFLRTEYERIDRAFSANDWHARKTTALARTSETGFWESPDRFSALGIAEYMDRIDTAFQVAGSLMRRLVRAPRLTGRARVPSDLVQRLATQLYLVTAAQQSVLAGHVADDGFVSVTASHDGGVAGVVANEFAARLGAMYRAWGTARRMWCDVLEEEPGDEAKPYRLVLVVSGLAAFPILEPEAGLHVFEIPRDDGTFYRARARVTVVRQPAEPLDESSDGRRRQAHAALAGGPRGETIVRRYREEPSPLVRDAVRGWRTGRLDLVLAGHFDLIV